MGRCFIGIFIPDGLKEKLLTLQKLIKNLGVDCRFVEAKNMHLTLSFLGEVPEIEIPKVSQKIDVIAQNFVKFSLMIFGILLIPNRNFIRVIALDVVDETGYLKNLVDCVGAEIGGDVKPPHLTLCRVRKSENKNDIISKLMNSDARIGDFQVDSISLIKSELTRGGPDYTVLHESKFRYS